MSNDVFIFKRNYISYVWNTLECDEEEKARRVSKNICEGRRSSNTIYNEKLPNTFYAYYKYLNIYLYVSIHALFKFRRNIKCCFKKIILNLIKK